MAAVYNATKKQIDDIIIGISHKIKQFKTHSLPDGCKIGGFHILSPTGAIVWKICSDLNTTTIIKLKRIAALKAQEFDKSENYLNK